MLVLLNGLPGSGKSTLARFWAAAGTDRVVVDVDEIRSADPHWRRDPHAAGLRARADAVDAVTDALHNGHDVVVPQFAGRTGFVDELAALDTGFRHVVLRSAFDVARRRLEARIAAPETVVHRDANELLAAAGGIAVLTRMASDLDGVLAARPGAVVVEPVVDDVPATHRRLVTALT